MKKGIIAILLCLMSIFIFSPAQSKNNSDILPFGEFKLKNGEIIKGSILSKAFFLKEFKKEKGEYFYIIIPTSSITSIQRVQDGNEQMGEKYYPKFSLKHTGSKLMSTDVSEELLTNSKNKQCILNELEKLVDAEFPESPLPMLFPKIQLDGKEISLTVTNTAYAFYLRKDFSSLLENIKILNENNQIVDLSAKELVSYKFIKSNLIKKADNKKQSSSDNYIPLTKKLSIGKIAYGLRKNQVRFALLKNMRIEQIPFKSHASKEFFILVFRGISDSSTVDLSLSDYSLVNKAGFSAGCKAYKMVFASSDIEDMKGFLTDKNISYHYDRTGSEEIFSCLLFVVDKDAKNLKLLYKNQVSNTIPEYDENRIKANNLFYKKEIVPGESFAQLRSEMVTHDINSFSLYGSYQIQKKPISVFFINSNEFEINDITRTSKNLIITVTLMDNSSASNSKLILDSSFLSMVKTDDNIWINSSGIPIEFEAGKFGPNAMLLLCNYVEDSNNIIFNNSKMTLNAGARLKDPEFSENEKNNINKLDKNSFRTVIPLVFEIPYEKKIISFKFSDFPEINLINIK